MANTFPTQQGPQGPPGALGATEPSLSALSSLAPATAWPAGTLSFVSSPIRRLFVLDPSNSLTVDNTTVLTATAAVGGGAWVDYQRLSGPSVPATSFGVTGNGSTDDTAALQLAMNTMAGTGQKLRISPSSGSSYVVSGSLTLPQNLMLDIAPGVSFTGTGGTAFSNITGCLTYTQGGTLAAPTQQTYFSAQPRDPTKAPFQFVLGGGKFNNTWDAVFYYGYNANGANTSEPLFRWNIEEDYEVTPGTHWFESYWEFFPVGRAYNLRPIYANADRATGASGVIVQIGTSVNDTFSLTSAYSGATCWSAYAGSMRFAPAGYLLMWTAAATGGMLASLNAAGNTFIYDMQHLAGDVLVLGSNAGAGHTKIRLDVAPSGVIAVGGTLTGVAAGVDAPLLLGSTPGISAATSFSLSTAQQKTPILQLTGTVPGGGTTITLPNSVGAWWKVDLSAVTLTGSLTFTTGSGTTAIVAAADLGSHKRLIDVVVSASNVVSWG